MQLSFLQIGFQKCGTTYLEKRVYPANPRIRCIQASGELALERALISQLIVPDGLEYDAKRARESLAAACDGLFAEDAINGVMFEPFTFMYERRFCRQRVLDRIRSLFPDARIITFVRSQEGWLLSHYSQYLKSGGLLRLHDFIECQLTNPLLDGHYIDWYPLVSYLYETFGSDHVLVCAFEDLVKSPQAVADTLFDFLQAPRVVIAPEPVNVSLSASGMALRRLLNHCVRYDAGASSYAYARDLRGAEPSGPARLRHRLIYNQFKPRTNTLCYAVDRLFGSKRKLALSGEQQRRVAARYGENNRRLAELLGTDLAAHGYPGAAEI
jgi:hypothetical protein